MGQAKVGWRRHCWFVKRELTIGEECGYLDVATLSSFGPNELGLLRVILGRWIVQTVLRFILWGEFRSPKVRYKKGVTFKRGSRSTFTVKNFL